jgi:hypothetical protein
MKTDMIMMGWNFNMKKFILYSIILLGILFTSCTNVEVGQVWVDWNYDIDNPFSGGPQTIYVVKDVKDNYVLYNEIKYPNCSYKKVQGYSTTESWFKNRRKLYRDVDKPEVKKESTPNKGEPINEVKYNDIEF